MKIVRVVRYLTSPSLDAVVEDNGGTLRKIQYAWKSKEGPKAPIPGAWIKAIEAEAVEARRKSEMGLSVDEMFGG